MKFFQILIPNYNSQDWIDNGLKSIFNQTYQDFVVHIADDWSTDNSPDIIREWMKKYPERITLDFLRNKSGYPGGTRNALIDKYKYSGEQEKTVYSLFMDSDDWLHDEECLRRIHDTAIEFGGETDLPDLIRLAFVIYESEKRQTYVDLKELTMKDITVSPFIAPWTKAVRTSKLTKFPTGTLFEDIPQHLAQCDVCETCAWVQEPTIVWNRRKDNTVSMTANLKTDENKQKLLISRFQMMADLYRLDLKHDYSLKMRDSWLEVGKGWLREEKLV